MTVSDESFENLFDITENITSIPILTIATSCQFEHCK